MTISYRFHNDPWEWRGSIGDDVVVRIKKKENHTHKNRDVYAVHVSGKELLGQPFRYIEEAREAGRSAYEATQK